MKNITVKIGKAIKIYSNEGFFSATKRIFLFLLNYIGILFSAKNGDILIVTGGVGDSARYRAKHYCEELNLHGLRCAFTLSDDPRLPKFTKCFKVFIFHRVIVSKKISALIQSIKAQEKTMIFDTDDLVFDQELFRKTESYRRLNRLEQTQYEGGVAREILTDDYTRVCTTTTGYLKKILEGYGKQVFVIRNKLCQEDLEICDKLLVSKKPSDGKEVVLGYFSGTMTHNKDFDTISRPLQKMLEKFPEARLLLAGPLEIRSEFSRFGDRIKKINFVPRKNNFSNITGIDINLAPLEPGDPFSESKSELKFFETGILKVPTVAVRNETFSSAISDGIDGYLAGSESEWEQKLENLITNRDLRISMGEKAREKCLKDYTTKNAHESKFYEYLLRAIEQSA